MKAQSVGNLLRSIAVLVMATGLLACGETANDDGDLEPGQIEVAGTWQTDFGTEEVIDDQRWGYAHLVDFDNDERWAITQNPSDDEYNPDAYNRLVWTPVESEVFYYCVIDFGLETEEVARSSNTSADEEDLDEGCGGFSWTEMTKQ